MEPSDERAFRGRPEESGRRLLRPGPYSFKSFHEKLLLLVERAGDIVWTVDLRMCPTYVSSSILHHLGYTAEEAMRTSMDKVFSPESFETAMRVLGEELAHPEGVVDRTRLLELDMLHKDGHLVPVEICYSALCDGEGNAVEILAIARNITERRRIEEENLTHARKLVQALQQAIQSLTALVELRDPYTAGHQRRVADLARAIARKLGLSEDTVEGVRFAGLIHDIGKIRVPAEILASTRRLSAAEYEIIKTHPAVGYEVLAGISFPWPIAEAVYQHHERMDGSGYPRGLVGADIILEARILAVADVVEAIASDRPYRKVLGLDFALREIADNSGRLFDESVVHACLELFREDDYALGREDLRVSSEDD